MFLSLPIVRSFLKLCVIYHFLLLLSFNINGCSGGEDLFPVSSHNFIIYTTKHVLSSFILFHGKGEILAALYPATDSRTPLRPVLLLLLAPSTFPGSPSFYKTWTSIRSIEGTSNNIWFINLNFSYLFLIFCQLLATTFSRTSLIPAP